MRTLVALTFSMVVMGCGGPPDGTDPTSTVTVAPPAACDGGAPDMVSYAFAICLHEPNYIRQNCIGKWDSHGEPCAVCADYRGCRYPGSAPGLGVYCTNGDGCADSACH